MCTLEKHFCNLHIISICKRRQNCLHDLHSDTNFSLRCYVVDEGIYIVVEMMQNAYVISLMVFNKHTMYYFDGPWNCIKYPERRHFPNRFCLSNVNKEDIHVE